MIHCVCWCFRARFSCNGYSRTHGLLSDGLVGRGAGFVVMVSSMPLSAVWATMLHVHGSEPSCPNFHRTWRVY